MAKKIINFILVFMLGLGWSFLSLNFARAQTTSTTYNTAGTFTYVVPQGVYSITVEAWGGGGAGGGQNLASDGGGGGGGGAYARSIIAVKPGESYTVVVGSGGTPVAGGTGGSGSNSTFNTTTVVACGGVGGAPSTGTPPAGGAGGTIACSTGQAEFAGGQGEIGRNNAAGRGGYGGSSAGTAADGFSGPQTWATEVYPTASTPTGAGHGGDGGGSNGAAGVAPASGNGGGGGGAAEGTNISGGAGAAGKVVVTYDDPIEISGKLYNDEGATADSVTGKTIKLFVGTSTANVYSTTTTASSGFWGFKFSPGGFANATGSPVIAWLDNGSSQKAVTVTKASSTLPGASITNLNLYKNHVIVRHEGFTGTSTTIADFAKYDADNDPDIPYRANAGILETNASNTLYIWPGTEFKPEGNATLHSNTSTNGGSLKLSYGVGPQNGGISTSSIFSLNGNSLTIGGSFYASSSSIFYSTATTTFTATTTGKNIIATSSPFYHVNFNSASSSGGWTFQASASSTGNFAITSGNLTSASTTLEIKGNYFNTGGRFIHNSGTTTFSGTSTQSLSGYMVGSSTLNHVEFKDAGEKIFSSNASTTNLIINYFSGTTTFPSLFSLSGNYTNNSTSTHSGIFYIAKTNSPQIVSNASYDSISKSISNENTTPVGLAFNNIGTKMYIVDQSSDKIEQYSLSSPWDLSTATTDSVNKSVSSQDTSANGVFFKNDGTKMYMVGSTNASVYQYTLSTPWDVSSATYDSISKGVSSEEATPYGVFINSEGTKMYITGITNNTVYQYSLPTAWSLSGATYDDISKSVSSQGTNAPALSFRSDGQKMYFLANSGRAVYQYSLPTAWSLSGATYDGISKSVTDAGLNPIGLFFKPDGTRMYIHGSVNKTVYQYSLPHDPQSFMGTMTGTSAFNDITVLNNGGNNGTTSPSVIFSEVASTTGTFTATQPNTKIQFKNNATTSINNLTLSGQAAGTKVMLRGATTTGGVDKYGLDVLGTASISYTDIMDANFCGTSGSNIQATDGTNQNSGNNSCIDFSAVTTMTQRNYGWASNDGNLSTGGLVAPNNTSITSASGTVHRLRMDVTAGGATLSAQTFTLRYKSLGAGCSSGTYATLGAIGSASIWRGYNNSGVTDGETLNNWILSPSNILQSYEEEGSSVSNPQAITVGNAGEWDWVIENNGAVEGETYCFKMVKTTGLTNLNAYTNYPQLTVAKASSVAVGGNTTGAGGENAPSAGVTGGGQGQGGGGGDVPPPPPGGSGGGGGEGGGGGGGIDYIPFYKLYAHLFNGIFYGMKNLSGLIINSIWTR